MYEKQLCLTEESKHCTLTGENMRNEKRAMWHDKGRRKTDWLTNLTGLHG